MNPADPALTVLVVLPNWLGDVVMATPLLDRLAGVRDLEGRPLRLVAAVRSTWAPILTRDPRLADTVLYERHGRHASWRGALALAWQWRGVRARSAVLCPPSLRVALVAKIAGVARRIGYRGDGRNALLSVGLEQLRPRGVRHHADELVALGEALIADQNLCDIEEPGPAMPRVPGVANVTPADTGAGPPVWILAPGATFGSAKAWPAARVAEFLRLAVNERRVRVAVVGDQAGLEITNAIRQETADLPWRRQWSGEAGIIDLVGETSLLDLVSVLRAGEAFVGNDSGVMHLAAALELPTLGLFGSSSVAWTAPRGRCAGALAAEGFACQPCFRPTCNQDRFCLDSISGGRALAALDDLIAGNHEESRP